MNLTIPQTVNLSEEVTKEESSKLILKINELGLKGAAVYDDGSRVTQMLYTGNVCFDLVD